MLGALIGEVGIQYDFLKTLLKEPGDQHTEDDPAKTTILAVGFADLDANFCNTFTHFSLAGFTDQSLIFFQDQATITQSCNYFFHSGTKPQGKACMSHHGTIIPPGSKLLRIRCYRITN